MRELFTNVSDAFKKRVELMFNIAMTHKDPYQQAKTLSDFVELCFNEEKEYADLYFKTKIQNMKN